ncbi:MAG: hypothetical protein SVK08_02180 [Halobacteriota archaeon]|nr:hypothetical protein [Halobacteriota archaeon]
MSEERNPAIMCQYYTYQTSLYKESEGVCESKLLVKEPVLMSSKNTKALLFLPNSKIHAPVGYDWKLRTSDDNVPFCIYICENGHIGMRPMDSADVPIVPPGTIVNPRNKMYNRPQAWYLEMSADERADMWKSLGVEFTPLDEISDSIKENLNIENYDKYK